MRLKGSIGALSVSDEACIPNLKVRISHSLGKIRRLIMGKFTKRQRYVSASEIGSATFCPRAYYYNINKAPSSKLNRSHRERGNIAHQELSKLVIEQSKQSFWLIRLIRWVIGLFKR